MEDKFTELSKATQNLRKISIILKKKQIVIIKYISWVRIYVLRNKDQSIP